MKNNWEISLRYRYAGKTPYVPINETLTLESYPRIILDYNSLGKVKLDVFSQGEIRIDKKWNFKKTSFNFYFEIQNFLAQPIPRPDEYGLKRNTEGEIVYPRDLIKVDTNRTQTPFPSFGFVLDF